MLGKLRGLLQFKTLVKVQRLWKLFFLFVFRCSVAMEVIYNTRVEFRYVFYKAIYLIFYSGIIFGLGKVSIFNSCSLSTIYIQNQCWHSKMCHWKSSSWFQPSKTISDETKNSVQLNILVGRISVYHSCATRKLGGRLSFCTIEIFEKYF